MGIYLGDEQGIAYKGDYKPVNIYHGSKKAAGWELSKKTGTELSWDNTYNDFAEVLIGGRTEQVQTVQGKNHYIKKGVIALTQNGVSITYDDATQTYTLNGTTTNIGNITLTLNMPCSINVGESFVTSRYLESGSITLPTGAYLLWSPFSMNGTKYSGRVNESNTNVNTIQLSQSGTWFEQSGGTGYRLYIQCLAAVGIVFNNVKVKFQLELSSTATAYEPFVPNSPSPEYPSPITSVGGGGIDFVSAGNSGQSYTAHRDIILRSLPDGTKDTYDAVTGQITRRVGFKAFDESIVWSNEYLGQNDASGYFTTSYFDSDICTQGNNAIAPGYCTHAHIVSLDTVYSAATTYDCLCLTGTQSHKVRFRIRREHLPEPTGNGFRHFLAAQHAAGTPVAVQYQLAQPTIEQIDPLPLPTYPRYTTLNCSEQMTAKVRVVEK